MKKSFKKAIAILLAVMMVVCAFPMSAFAADEAKPNVNIRLGAFTSDATNTKYYKIDRNHAITGINAISGINSTALDYTGTAITGYGVGDYFTATVVLENVSQIAAAQIAVKYSDTIEPAGVLSGTAGFYSGSTTATPYATYVAGEAIAAQSGDALYNAAHTVGEMSYAADGVMYADFAVQDGSDYVTSSTGSFYLATFAFKIVKAGDITFSMVDDATEEDAFFLGTLENGGQVEEYVTFVETENDGSKGLGFMGKDADGESVIPTKSYTITFVDAEGTTISTGTYNEGATVTAPELPSTTKDAENHYTYAWDVTPAATATADATYTVVKTPAAHTWNTGVETIPATEEAEGEMTYTCTVCSQTKTEPIKKLEPSHTHEYVWVYNGGAVYNSVDGTATGTCSCGDIQTKSIENTKLLRINSVNLTLGSNIALNAKINATTVNKDNFASVYVVVEKVNSGTGARVATTIEESEYQSGSTPRYQYVYDNFAPQNMMDAFDITFHAITKDGLDVWGPTYTHAGIASYAKGEITKASNATKKNYLKMLVDMLVYGAQAQIYQNYNVDTLATSVLTPEQLALGSGNVTPSYVKTQDTSFATITAPSKRWRATGLVLDSAVRIRLRLSNMAGAADMTEADLENIAVKVKVDGGLEYLITYEEHPECFAPYTSAGQFYFYFNELAVSQIRNNVYYTVCDKEGNAISNTLAYTAETFVMSQSGGMRTLLDKMMVYADACAAYVANPNA